MKTKNTVGFLAVLTLIVGCATQPRGPAYGHEREFRQQVAESVPVRDWGYTIQKIRFSADYHKALVVFAVPGKTNLTEVVMEDDGFRRYRGGLTDWDRMGKFSAKPGDPDLGKKDTAAMNRDALKWQASIRVAFPDK